MLELLGFFSFFAFGLAFAGTSPRDWTAGETVTATLMDTEVKDNISETGVQKVTTLGDTLYATASKTLARLAVGANGAIKHVASNIPAWLALGTRGKVLRVNDGATAAEYVDVKSLLNLDYGEVGTSQSTASTSYTDLATAGPDATVYCPTGDALIFWHWIGANSTSGARCTVGVRTDASDPSGQRYTQFENETNTT
ncbi:MAG TPA: hypothetical protein ENI05_08580, partial [Porticoccus sp.]|nr:hypothetical protein [Porticoccus sp.]